MIAIQYDDDGRIHATVNIPEPNIVAPLRQIFFPDGAITQGMMLDLSQDPPILIPAEIKDESEPAEDEGL